jgi:Zn-dependent alcohol dehydrogenase
MKVKAAVAYKAGAPLEIETVDEQFARPRCGQAPSSMAFNVRPWAASLS